MSHQNAADELFEVKNNFYLGNFQAAINEGTGIAPSSEALQEERDAYVYRAYIAQGNYDIVLSELNTQGPASLQAVRLLASYLKNPEVNKETTLASVREWLVAPTGNGIQQLVAGTIFFHEGLFDEALRSLHMLTSLEGRALRVQILLKMDRVNLALKELKSMKEIDEDNTLTQLTMAWVNLATGEDIKVQEAAYIFQELAEKYNPTVLLLNGRALCFMHQKKFAEAEKALLEALEKNPKDPETLINAVVCFLHVKKPPELIGRYLNQLRTSSPHHPWVVRLQQMEESFERTAARFIPTVKA